MFCDERITQLELQLSRARIDIQAYRGALGYSVSGDHDGLLSDCTMPNNGIAEALQQQLAAATERADRAEREATVTILGLETAMKAMIQSSQQNARNFRHAEVLRIEAERRAERAERESAEYIRTTDPILNKLDGYLDQLAKAELVLREIAEKDTYGWGVTARQYFTDKDRQTEEKK